MRFYLAAAFALAAAPALADDPFVTGIWAQSEELCKQAKAEGVGAIAEAGNTVLTPRGIESIEYNCEFTNIRRVKLAPGWIVDAFCQETGRAFPDVLTVLEMSPGQIELVSVVPMDPENPSGNSGYYYLCDGVTMP